MTATLLWARNELRQRWRALVVLGVIGGLAAGLALAALTQARRSSTVYSRFRTATAAPDAIVFGTQTGVETAVDYGPVLALPAVVDGGKFNLAPVAIKEYPDLGSLATDDSHLYRTTARPLLRSGRLPDPNRDDEIVVNELAAKKHDLHVGDHVTLVSSNDLAAFFGTGKYEGGPTIAATIVGVGNSPLDFVFTIDEPAFVASGAVLSKHPEIPRYPNLVVRLAPGTDVGAFHRDVAKVLELPDIPVRDLAEERKRFVHGTDLERTALLLFAAAVALAGIVLVGQALARTVYGMAAPGSTLSALGLTRHDLVTGLVLPTVLTAAVAGAVGVATAVALSRRFTVGLSRTLEPDLGTHADWLVLAPGALGLVALMLTGAAVAALRATRPRRDAVRASPAVLAALRSVVPLPVALGASMALDPGRGPRSTPVRPALAGAVAGVLGIVGALGLVRGIDDALAKPERAGQSWDAFLYPSEERSIEELSAAIRDAPNVAAVAQMTRRPMDVNGEGLPVYALRAQRGRPGFTVLDGAPPAADDEASLAPASLRALDKRVGDRVTIAGLSFRVVGRSLLPQTAHSSFDQGVWVTPSGMTRLKAPSDPFGDQVVVKAVDGVELQTFEESLRARVGDAEIEVASPPQDLLLLRNVRTLPRVLAAFLGLLGVAALGHALVTSVRRRRHDLAVLRAIGFRPRQNAAMIAWQATTVAVIGLLIGLPLGVATGRISWRWVAESTPLLYVAPIAGLAVALAVPATLAVANGLAALPARRAARLRAVEVLRTE
jgi:ABC-type lipoprotein release transport system permease subunit